MSDKEKLRLYGFNNLTKNLSFSFYKLHYLKSNEDHNEYNRYVNDKYSAANLSHLLTKICHAIGGNILNIAQQNYQPQGASVTLMISEEAQAKSLVGHLDKSHICVHTYPDDNIQNNIAIFRADIELSTCGVISPLNVLNYLIDEFAADVIDIDYRVRGMTRNFNGDKQFNDQEISSVSEYLSDLHLANYHLDSSNLIQDKLFYSKLCLKGVQLNESIFRGTTPNIANQQLSDIASQKDSITSKILNEREQLFKKLS